MYGTQSVSTVCGGEVGRRVFARYALLDLPVPAEFHRRGLPSQADLTRLSERLSWSGCAAAQVGMETYQIAQIVVVFCCLVGLWVRGGQEPVQGYIFTVAFVFLCFTMAVLTP